MNPLWNVFTQVAQCPSSLPAGVQRPRPAGAAGTWPPIDPAFSGPLALNERSAAGTVLKEQAAGPPAVSAPPAAYHGRDRAG